MLYTIRSLAGYPMQILHSSLDATKDMEYKEILVNIDNAMKDATKDAMVMASWFSRTSVYRSIGTRVPLVPGIQYSLGQKF